ncbi:hypothetical protein BJX76DRAFT_257963 [Aspergillus varians]
MVSWDSQSTMKMKQTARLWKELGFEGQHRHPFPTGEVLASHEKQHNFFKTAQSLRTELIWPAC